MRLRATLNATSCDGAWLLRGRWNIFCDCIRFDWGRSSEWMREAVKDNSIGLEFKIGTLAERDRSLSRRFRNQNLSLIYRMFLLSASHKHSNRSKFDYRIRLKQRQPDNCYNQQPAASNLTEIYGSFESGAFRANVISASQVGAVPINRLEVHSWTTHFSPIYSIHTRSIPTAETTQTFYSMWRWSKPALMTPTMNTQRGHTTNLTGCGTIVNHRSFVSLPDAGAKLTEFGR